jgi:uncharacterized protein YndB with AHSA1/START domain
MKPINSPFFWETHIGGKRHAHYGGFLRRVRGRLVELTWITGAGGTGGAETVVTIELTARGTGTDLHLTLRIIEASMLRNLRATLYVR